MPDPANDGNVNPPAAGAPRTTRSRGGVSTGEYNNMLNARLAANATPFGIWAAAAAASPSSSVYRNTTDQCVAYMSSVDGQIMPMPDNIVPKHYKDIASISDPKLRDMWRMTPSSSASSRTARSSPCAAPPRCASSR